MQGGSIGIQSTQGVGSTFSFYIKSRKATSPHAYSSSVETPSRPKAEIIHETPVSSPTTPPPTLPKYHIIVVKDNLINQRVL